MSTFCYLGIYQPTWAHDTVLLKGLEARGAKIILLTDNSPGWRKYWLLWHAHRHLHEPYDYLLVGYLSNAAVPLARLLARRPVIFNASNSLYEGAVLDRGAYGPWSPRRYWIWLIDWLAFRLAHLILVESVAQKKFLHHHFGVAERKIAVLFAGADDAVFHPDPAVPKTDALTALFRGWLVSATGVEQVLAAAKLLRNEEINFLLIGRGPLLAKVRQIIADDHLTRVKLITEFLPETELRRQMSSAHVALGQFSAHPRLERTIQNKTFEALALGLPYITRDSPSNRELLTDGENCLFVQPANPVDLAAKILLLKNNPILATRLAQNARALYEQKLTPRAIADKFLKILKYQS
ncbi:MAG: glycosyltransferase family 4 protein [Patescibacteria group bacterium]